MRAKNELFEKLLQFQYLINKLSKNGIIKEKIELPKICAIGDIGAGKTCTLESILNLNILPLSKTLRPIEINLNNIEQDESYAIFENIRYDDFSKIKEKIQNYFYDQENINSISQVPLLINIYSKNVPNLSLIDLPGFSRLRIGEAPKSREELPIRIAEKYINDPLTIILCVIPANALYSHGEYHALSGLRITKDMDLVLEYNNNLRRICVLTKIDIMYLGTNGKNLLLNKEMPNELGYIGILNRSRTDIINNISQDKIYEKEKYFFSTNEIYKDLPKEIVGIDALIKKISKIYFKLIKDNIFINLKNNDTIKIIIIFLG